MSNVHQPTVPSDIDLLDEDRFLAQEHHGWFTRLRAERPVSWHEEPDGPGFWNVTKYEDLVEVNRDTERFSSELGGTQIMDMDADSGFDMRGVLMLETDPPKHTRYRLLVNKGFTPRMIGLLEKHLEYRAELIVDQVVEAGECEFVTDLAAELPLQAIAEIMGVPQEERHLIFEWSNKMVGATDPEYNDKIAEDQEASPHEAAMELYAYAQNLGQQRREDPRDDIVTKLINAEIDGDKLTETEFEIFMLLLAVAGNETTRNATAHGMHAFLQNPDQLLAVRDDRSLLDNAVEEIIRWATPVMYFRRTATCDTRIGDVAIGEGEKVVMWHISANRDEDVFDDPFRFDIRRHNATEHIGFGGGGAHYCLGANLARAELRIIFNEILDRLDNIEVAGPVERLRSGFINGIKHLPISFTSGPRKHS